MVKLKNKIKSIYSFFLASGCYFSSLVLNVELCNGLHVVYDELLCRDVLKMAEAGININTDDTQREMLDLIQMGTLSDLLSTNPEHALLPESDEGAALTLEKFLHQCRFVLCLVPHDPQSRFFLSAEYGEHMICNPKSSYVELNQKYKPEDFSPEDNRRIFLLSKNFMDDKVRPLLSERIIDSSVGDVVSEISPEALQIVEEHQDLDIRIGILTLRISNFETHRTGFHQTVDEHIRDSDTFRIIMDGKTLIRVNMLRKIPEGLEKHLANLFCKFTQDLISILT